MGSKSFLLYKIALFLFSNEKLIFYTLRSRLFFLFFFFTLKSYLFSDIPVMRGKVNSINSLSVTHIVLLCYYLKP